MTKKVRLQLRSKWGILIRLPLIGYNHYRIFRRIYSRWDSFTSSFRLIKSTFIWRFFSYDRVRRDNAS